MEIQKKGRRVAILAVLSLALFCGEFSAYAAGPGDSIGKNAGNSTGSSSTSNNTSSSTDNSQSNLIREQMFPSSKLRTDQSTGKRLKRTDWTLL